MLLVLVQRLYICHRVAALSGKRIILLSVLCISTACRKPDDWTLSWGGSGQIWVWGHNHRGQLGGVEGAKVKLPIGCESLASLRPVQLIGGEQTLFAVTADGKVSMVLVWLVFAFESF